MGNVYVAMSVDDEFREEILDVCCDLETAKVVILDYYGGFASNLIWEPCKSNEDEPFVWACFYNDETWYKIRRFPVQTMVTVNAKLSMGFHLWE